MSTVAAFPDAAGTYVLLLEAESRRRFRVGALGWIEVIPGFYAYAGSARGPGGLAARLGHHLKPAAKPHWHVDHLRRCSAVRAVWFSETGENREHDWARALAGMPGSTVPVKRFGASDCRCVAHLCRFRERPTRALFAEALSAGRAPCDPVQEVVIGPSA